MSAILVGTEKTQERSLYNRDGNILKCCCIYTSKIDIEFDFHIKNKTGQSVSATVSINDDEMDDDSEDNEKEVDDETPPRTTDTASECDTQTDDYFLSPGGSTSGVETSKKPRVFLC
ncbi:hypothetical protein FQR65_LT08638 [Abscondita terminalis]|nr:hypothetical protein FQR65_LT08638 [Abscondita terminalis]